MELGITLQGRHVAGGLNVFADSCPGGVEINGQSTPDIQVRVQDEAKAPHTLNHHSNQSQASVLHVSDPISECSSGITRRDREVDLRLFPCRNPTPSSLKDRENSSR